MFVQCPYCKKELLKFPTRKTRCSYCDNFIYVRTRPSDRQRILVTKKEAKALEFKKSLEDSNLGFTEEKYLKIRERLNKRFGFNPSEGDILWGMSNQLLQEAMKKGDWDSMKMIYFEQALFLHQSGKDCFKLLQESAKCELRRYQQNDVVKKVEILTAGDQSCLVCQKLAGKTLTIEEAFRDMPIPVKDCSHKINPEAPTGWCRCCYISVVE